MTLRAPLLPPDAVQNRFGWRHEGAGPQLLDNDALQDDALLPPERFGHPNLKRRPPYVPERLGPPTFSFALRKSCAGLAYHYRRDPDSLYDRILTRTIVADDGPALRWMLSGLQFSTDFVRLHTSGRLTIEELAYVTREAFGDRAPYRTWLNQWGREPTRALPSLPAEIRLDHPNELLGLDVRDLEPDDDRRIAVGDTLYIKLNGHVYRISTELLDTAAPHAAAAPPAAAAVVTPS